MADIVWVEVFKCLGIAFAAVYAYLSNRKAAAAVAKTEEVRREINGPLHALLERTAAASLAEGKIEGAATEQKRVSKLGPPETGGV